MAEPLVSNHEVAAAKAMVDKFAEFAGHKPVPDFIVRFILEEAAMVRTGMKPMPVAPTQLVQDRNTASGWKVG
ncbi:hypothetical protein AB8A05_04290 [Tardiphaga sp. 538_B7_N1_4]|uniref:hypothetical protein n=1 Tax=Tardiphaga sp. 538_B7_N1_4 TaxID=3240778 RepID=UPI003F23B20B